MLEAGWSRGDHTKAEQCILKDLRSVERKNRSRATVNDAVLRERSLRVIGKTELASLSTSGGSLRDIDDF